VIIYLTIPSYTLHQLFNHINNHYTPTVCHYTILLASKEDAQNNRRWKVQIRKHNSRWQFRKGLRRQPLRHKRNASALPTIPEQTSHRHHHQLDKNTYPTQPRKHCQIILSHRGGIVHLYGDGAVRWGSEEVH